MALRDRLRDREPQTHAINPPRAILGGPIEAFENMGKVFGSDPDELRHTFATRLSAGGIADHMVTQMLTQGDAEVFKLDSQAKLGMMREALTNLDRQENERGISNTQKASELILCTFLSTISVLRLPRRGLKY